MSHLFLKSALWDFVLTFAVSCALAYTLLAGFNVDPSLHHGALPALLCAVTLLALFAASSSRRVMRVGVPLVAVALIGSWVAGASLTPGGAWLVDNESNYLVFTMCVTLCALGCFILSRTRVGCALLFIVGAFLVAFIQFFYRFDQVGYALLFVTSSLALVMFKNYQVSLRASTGVKKVMFAPGFAVAVCAAVVAVGIGAGVWFGVIAPLDPQAVEVKLITEHRALETVSVKGVGDVYQVANLDMTSDETNEGERTTDDIKESESGRPMPANGNPERQEQEEEEAGSGSDSFLGIDLDSLDQTFNMFDYRQLQLIAAIVGLVLLLAVLGYFIGRRIHRSRRYSKLAALSPSEQVKRLYPFFVAKLERLGICKAPGQTLDEYAAANASTMGVFDEAAGVPFTALTHDYMAVAYGDDELGPDAADRLGAYYRAFWKAARRKVGNVRYFFKSFRLG